VEKRKIESIFFDDDLLEAASITDTEAAFHSNASKFPYTTFPNTPPIVLVSQLYHSVSNRSDVDKELEQLYRASKLRIFKLLSGKNDYAVVKKDDYMNGIRKAQEKFENATVFDKFIENVLSKHFDVYISKSTLISLLCKDKMGNKENFDGKKIERPTGEEEAAITALVNSGLLLTQNADNFMFCVPNAGSFVASLVKGRKEIISILKRQKFKELLLSDLQIRKLRYSSLSVDFLIRDMIGLSIVESLPTTNGNLIRLIDVV